jgi:excisionase family DNA binding protein
VDAWVTYAQAADILGCHVSAVPKMVRRGELNTRGRQRGALSREQVEELAYRRRTDRQRPKGRAHSRPRIDHRLDHEHEWLTPCQVADLTGVTAVAVRRRIHRGRLPAVESGGRLWVRYDHLQLVERARLAGRTRVA